MIQTYDCRPNSQFLFIYEVWNILEKMSINLHYFVLPPVREMFSLLKAPDMEIYMVSSVFFSILMTCLSDVDYALHI